MVIVDHGEIDGHRFPFSVARVEHIYNKPSEEKFGQMRVCYHTVHFKRGKKIKKKKITNPSKLLNCSFIPYQLAAPSHNKHAKKQSFVPHLGFHWQDNIILVFERLVNTTIQNELRTIPHPRHKQFLEHVQIWASLMTVILPNLILKIASYNNYFDEIICPSIEVLFFHVYIPYCCSRRLSAVLFCFFQMGAELANFQLIEEIIPEKSFLLVFVRYNITFLGG